MNELIKEKLMTTKELANALSVSERTIQKHAKEMGITSNGKKTFFTEKQAIEIKTKIKESGRKDLANVCEVSNIKSDLEIMQNFQNAFADFIALKDRKISELENQNNQLEHALEYDKVKDWKPWNLLKKQIDYKGNFKKLIKEIPLIEDEDFSKKVMGMDKYPTTLISFDGEEKIIDYKESVLDEIGA